MKHERSIGAGSDEGTLHTFVMDYCFPSQGSQQRDHCADHQRNQDQGDQHVHGFSDCLVKAVVDFMSGCWCCHAIPKRDGEPAIRALQEAVKNSAQSDTILENSPKEDSQSIEAAENAVREAERKDTHMEDVCRGRVESSARQQARAASVARGACRSDHHEVQDGS